MSNISIIIPILNEENYIKECLNSILESDYPKEFIELLLVDGGSTDKTLLIIKEYQSKYDFIKLLHNKQKIVPISMNIAIKESKGDYIIRLDAHSLYPKNYLSKLIYWHNKLDASNVGAVITTEVKNKNKKSNSIKNILSSKFGVGNSDFRIGVNSPKEVDTVPFGCYKKEVFEKYGLYDERLKRNQDIELNKRIVNNKGKIYLIPDVKCTYFARETFKDLAKNNYANGKWNILTAFYTSSLNSLSIRHFIPLLFVLSLIIPLFGSFIELNIIYITLLSFVSYLTLVIIISFRLKSKENNLLYLISSFFVLHLSYGFGSLVGIMSVIKKMFKGEK